MNTKRDHYPAFVDSTIEKQRDDLLAMLERVTEAIEHGTHEGALITDARALISSIKGE